jgi:hypothetical protein
MVDMASWPFARREKRSADERSQRALVAARWELLVVVSAFGMIAADSTLATQPDRSLFEKISIVGEDHRNGLFDVSIEYDDTGTGWLAYSRVTIPKHVETHVAKSTDRGKTWSYVGPANRSTETSAVINGTVRKGALRYETPTLLFDPNDDGTRRWKLLVQRYLAIPPYRPGDSFFADGWIEYTYAPSPAGPWSEPSCLFGKKANHCRVDLTSIHPDLKHYVFFNELGSIVVDGTIYVSMDASPTSTGLGEWERRKIVLISSPDRGVTWSYAGTLTHYDDARTLGYRVLTGSSLVKEDGRLFLLITPSGATGLSAKNRAHDGTLVVEFDDIRRARLKRDARGNLRVLKTFKPDLHSGGLSDYDEQNTSGGILFSQIDIRAKGEFFKIFRTNRGIAQPGAAADADMPRR